ncbi:MAG: hypothetical protein V4736_06750 [Bdellovibrionota bacterium]
MVITRAFFASIILFAATFSVAATVSDSVAMEKARQLYADGKLKEAISLYAAVPATSDFWLDAIEEKAWAKTRQGNFESALGDLQSITSAIWSSQVGPETYMLSTFVSLKICAFKDVTKKINLFKERMLPRVEALQSVIDNGAPPEFMELIPALKQGKVTMNSLGNKAEKFPRFFYRDLQLIGQLKEGQTAAAAARLKELAQADLKEIEINLKKMKIIEVELIQKVLMADDLKQQSKNLKFAKIDKNKSMVFPVNDDEVWVDEVGHFQVKADNCPFATKEKSL